MTATSATTLQPCRNRNQKPWLRTPLATMLQPSHPQPAQPSRNRLATARNHRATINFQAPQPLQLPLKGWRFGCAPLPALARASQNTPAKHPPAFGSGCSGLPLSKPAEVPSRPCARLPPRTRRATDHAANFEEGRDCPRHRQSRVESCNQRIVNSAASPRLSRRQPHSMSTAITDPADTRHTCPHQSRHSLEHLATHDVLTETDQWVIGFGRCTGNSGVAKTVGARGNQAIGAIEALAMQQSRFPRIEPEARGVWVGVAGRSFARPILDLFAFFRGPALKNLAAVGSEKVGWPVKPAALTQRRCVIGQIALAATRERAGAKTHQRPFLSHGGGMSL
jgi:hypothetical protein